MFTSDTASLGLPGYYTGMKFFGPLCVVPMIDNETRNLECVTLEGQHLMVEPLKPKMLPWIETLII